MTYTVAYHNNALSNVEGADTAAHGFFKADSAGAPTFVLPLADDYNSSASYPASTTTAGWAITSNYLGYGETDIWSTVNREAVNGEGIYFLQKTAATTVATLGAISGDASPSVEFFFNADDGSNYCAFGGDATQAYFVAYFSYKFTIWTNNTIAVTFETDQTTRFHGEFIRLEPAAFAALPAAGTFGRVAAVSDSNTATWGATVAGGGANKVLALDNGTNWTVFGA